MLEKGFADASCKDVFEKQLRQLEEKWSRLHDNGLYFHDWFKNHKSGKFINGVINPVRQRAGLGCPPERFTTNRSEKTNSLLQEFASQDYGKKKVGRGEYRLREKFQYLEKLPNDWSKMREEQRLVSFWSASLNINIILFIKLLYITLCIQP